MTDIHESVPGEANTGDAKTTRGDRAADTTANISVADAPRKVNRGVSALFAGYEHAHGLFEIKRSSDKGKKEGKALTVKEPLTLEKWQAHLDGTGPGVGVIPLLADNTVRWGCIDIDVYGVDHNALERWVRDLSLPLVIARSKSGGAHAFLFLSERVSAAEVRHKLKAWAAALGHRGCEVFPKQTKRDQDEDLGNWLNMPYYTAERTARYAIKDGEPLSLEEFVAYANERQVTAQDLKAVKVPDSRKAQRDDDPFKDGPPCLQTLRGEGGFPEGTRNDGMYNVVVYLKKRFPSNWKDKLDAYNEAMCVPPLPSRELQQLAASVEKKDYDYKCNEQPICGHCQYNECVTRQHGIGGASLLHIEELKKCNGDPVIWYAKVQGQWIQFSIDELQSQTQFQRKVANAINYMPPLVKQAKWIEFINSLMERCEVEDAPEDASPQGQFNLLVEQYCMGLAQAGTKEELAHRMVPFNTGDGYIWFRSRGLLYYLNNHGFKYESEHHVWQMLRELGAEHKVKNVKRKSFKVWILPEFETTEEDAPLPDFGGEEF